MSWWEWFWPVEDVEDLKRRVSELEKIVKEAGLVQEEIRKNVKSIASKFSSFVYDVKNTYESRKKRIESLLTDLGKDIALIGSTKVKNSILYKMQESVNKIVSTLGTFTGLDPTKGYCGASSDPARHGARGSGILWELGCTMWRLSCLSDCMRKAIVRYNILGVTFYGVNLAKLYKAMDYAYAMNLALYSLQREHLPRLIDNINNFIAIAGDLSQITKHAVDTVSNIVLETANLMKDIAEKIANLGTEIVRLEETKKIMPKVVKSSEVIKERISVPKAGSPGVRISQGVRIPT